MVAIGGRRSKHSELYADGPEALVRMGQLRAREGHMTDAIDCFAAGLASMRHAGDRRGEADTFAALGLAFADHGRRRAAAACWTLSLSLLRDLGDGRAQARVLRNLGGLHAREGNWRASLACYRDSLALRRTGSARGAYSAP